MDPINPTTPSPASMPQEGEIPVSLPPVAGQTPVPPIETTSTPSGGLPPVTPSPRKFPKKILFILMGILALALVVFAVVKFVLPSLGGSGGSKNNLVWWGLWEDATLVQPLIDEYQTNNPGITIEYVKNDKQDYRERLMSALARGEGPDLFRIHSSWVPMFKGELSTAPASVMSSEEFSNTFYPVASADLLGPEGPYAIPLMYDGLAMFINEDIFTTYGKTVPTEWNELRQTARALTIKDERGVITQSGASLGTTANVDHWPEIVALLMLQNLGNPNTPEDANHRGAEALSFYKQFAETDGIWDDTQPESTVAFAAGRVGIYFGPSWRALEIMERNPSLRFRVEAVPQIPQGDSDTPDFTYASYWAEAVSDKSAGSTEAWKFLKFLSEKESLAKLYENATKNPARPFGEPYPRVDMRELLLAHPVLGGFMRLAPTAKSGFLHSRTFDGVSGINTSLSQYYADALAEIDPERSGGNSLVTLAAGVNQVLARYGLQRAAPVPAK